MSKLPPIWLACCAVASWWAAVYSLGRWTVLFVLGPVHEDLRFTYVAAEAGLRFGWSKIYDPATLQSLSTSFPSTQQYIHGSYTYINPPLLAWIFAPFTLASEPAAYAMWTLVSLGALVCAWFLAAPYSGLARVTLLLLAIGLWPLLWGLYLGQPDLLVIALVAAAWWFCARDMPIGTGVALALATFLKPQVVIVIPLALLVSARYRHVAAWVIACAALGAATVAALGSSGLASWWEALKAVQADPAQTNETLARILGLGPLTYALWALQGAAALFVAYRRREAEIVFAAGILGSAAVGFHFHYWDYTCLVLAAWLVLRTSPQLAHRLWLATGVVPMQVMTYQASSTTLVLVAPQLAWDAVWLAILVVGSVGETRVPAAARVPAVKGSTDPVIGG